MKIHFLIGNDVGPSVQIIPGGGGPPGNLTIENRTIVSQSHDWALGNSFPVVLPIVCACIVSPRATAGAPNADHLKFE